MKKRLITIVPVLAIFFGPMAAQAQNSDAGPAIEQIDAAPKLAQEPAAPATEPTAVEKAEENPLGTAAEVVDDVRAGDWRHAVAGLLVLVMLGLSKGRDKVPWFNGDRGGAALVLFLGTAGGIVTTLYASGPLDWRIFAGALSTSFTAAGFYTIIKQLFWPKDRADKPLRAVG